MKYHMTAFFLGFLLDLLLGDPYWLPHPIRLIGSFIAKTERRLLGKMKERNAELERGKGILLVVSVLTVTAVVSAGLLFGAYLLHPCLGVVLETVMTYQILAAKCLKAESMKVYRCLSCQNTEEARKAVSMIVGRDTDVLDEEGIAKAAVETVAENTSDGVIAPMLYTALGGPVLGFFYKAVNTMDSMVGYKNEKYLHFGRAAAKLDDVINFIPARISAYLMIAAAFCGGKRFSGKHAYAVYRRDKRKHASPNSAQTESVCAGALGIRLAGDASYFGKVVKKPYIGDAHRAVSYEDIKYANRLMYITAWTGEVLCLACMAAVYFLTR
ncbi:MAG: cobalamin biosynthesis protein CobD [Lachnospiraceae bacterium]|nr:cobalamin biosynthesis protein CobD [Lachnospiraceae bacterium]